MDKFLVKPKKKPCSITPQERANQYPGKFHADDNLLFCSTCNVVVDICPDMFISNITCDFISLNIEHVADETGPTRNN